MRASILIIGNADLNGHILLILLAPSPQNTAKSTLINLSRILKAIKLQQSRKTPPQDLVLALVVVDALHGLRQRRLLEDVFHQVVELLRLRGYLLVEITDDPLLDIDLLLLLGQLGGGVVIFQLANLHLLLILLELLLQVPFPRGITDM